MSVEHVDVRDDAREDLEAFSAALEEHPWGYGRIECRVVAADDDPGGVERALERWMKPEEYKTHAAAEEHLSGFVGGQVIIAKDDSLTAVIGAPAAIAQSDDSLPAPRDERVAFLGVAAHELVEAARRAERIRRGWKWPFGNERNAIRQQRGLIVFGEYVADRARLEIARELDWPESEFDTHPQLAQEIRRIQSCLFATASTRPRDPPLEFNEDWLGMARVWAAVAGRRAAGSEPEDRVLDDWASHELIAQEGWRPVEQTMSRLYKRPERDDDELARITAEYVFDPVLDYGGHAWHPMNPLPPATPYRGL